VAPVDVGEVTVRRPRRPAPRDASVDYEGDGPLAPEVVDNDDPSPGGP
jgi:hypothetical protein